jgi:hypothetical protein
MSKSIFYRLFGVRRVPIEMRNRLESEGIVFDEEGTSCALAFRDFRGSHKYSGRGWKSGAVGTLVITKSTLYISLPYMISCHQPIDEAIRYLHLELTNPDKLAMKFKVEKLFEHSSGNLTCYWRTENASAIFDHLRGLQEGHSS